MNDRQHQLFREIRAWTVIFIIGLLLSGITAIPLEAELDWMVNWTGAGQIRRQPASIISPAWASWLILVQDAVRDTNGKYPFLAYGTDWLAFGHFVIAVAFIGLLRDPVRNRWLIDFGLIACGLVVPYAFVFGGLRGIPVGWRLIDSSFGVLGVLPLWCCRHSIQKLELLLNEQP